MKKKIDKFKDGLAQVFDDTLRTKQWQNIVDYCIIGLIILSTLEILLSTFDDIAVKYSKVLHFIDVFTTIFFTIEVSLRIWVADRIDKKYSGFLGRLRYCFSFYGLIDILATYPFYIHLFFPIPYRIFKVLRVARLFRIFRYMKSFRLLTQAIKSKKREMLVSLQFLCIITLILSFIMYFIEHEAQPEVYTDGMYSFLWAFAKYIDDPGGFAETPPITIGGQVIACIVGILGIAIFAVPTGLIGAGFTEAMDEENHKNDLIKWTGKLQNAFERKLDRNTGYQIVPKFITFQSVQARLGFKEDQIFDAIEASGNCRVINLASMRPLGKVSSDILAIETFPINKSYGCFIDRQSLVTIVAPSNVDAPVIGRFAYYIAKLGGFNYISRETGQRCPYRSFYLFDSVNDTENLAEYMNDLTTLTKRPGSWCFTIIASSGANEQEYPSQFHFEYGGKKGDESYDGEDLLIKDIALFAIMYNELSQELEKTFDIKCDRQKYHNTSSPRVYARKMDRNINHCILRVAWSLTCWSNIDIQVAEIMARIWRKNICKSDLQIEEDMKLKALGYDYGDQKTQITKQDKTA